MFGGKPAEPEVETENSESKEEESKPETDKTDDTFPILCRRRWGGRRW